MKYYATKDSLKAGGRMQLVGRRTSHPCPGKCGRMVSNNKACCLSCFQSAMQKMHPPEAPKVPA